MIGQVRQHGVGGIEQHQVVRDAGRAIRRQAAPAVLPADRAPVSVPEPARVLAHRRRARPGRGRRTRRSQRHGTAPRSRARRSRRRGPAPPPRRRRRGWRRATRGRGRRSGGRSRPPGAASRVPLRSPATIRTCIYCGAIQSTSAAERAPGGLGDDRRGGTGHLGVGGEHRLRVGARLGGEPALARPGGHGGGRARPLWRSPSSAPSPRSSRSTSASSKPSEIRAIASRRARAVVGGGVGEEHAVALVRAAPHPAAQLMELGQAEEVGLLDHHHRRVRDVHADLDHRRRDQHLHLAGAEAVHDPPPLGHRELAVDALQAVALELARAQAGGLGLGRGGRAGVVALGHERADDVRLAAFVQQPAHAREHLVAPLQAEYAGDDRRSPRRQLVEHRHLEVAVDATAPASAGSGSPSCAARAATALAGLLLERLALLDAEPVLLVDDGHAQLPVVDARLDQGVRPDRNRGSPDGGALRPPAARAPPSPA